MPQLRETGLNALPHLAQQLLLSRRVFARDEQEFGLFGHQPGSRLTTIPQVANQDAAVAALTQGQQRVAVITRGRQEQDVQEASRYVAQGMQLKAEEPTLRAFTETSAVFTQKS